MAETETMALQGLEFIEIATANPAHIKEILSKLGFCEIATHRSKAVTLFRQGALNFIVNASPEAKLILNNQEAGHRIKAIAVQVNNATSVYNELLNNGAWGCSSSPGAMELNIPGIEIIGGNELYLVSKYSEYFSIYDIDFTLKEQTTAVDPVLDKVTALEISVISQHYNHWVDLFKQLLHFSFQNETLTSPDGSFQLKINRLDTDEQALEGLSGLIFSTKAENPNSLLPSFKRKASTPSQFTLDLPSEVEFEVTVTV